MESNSRLLENDRKIIVYLFLAALAAHLVYLSQYAKSPFFWVPQLDALYHDLLAQQIIAGHAPREAFFRAPLYYYALAGVYRVFGHSYWAARIIQAVCGSVSCVLTYRLGRAVFGQAAGIIAGAAMVLYGPLVFADGELHTPVLEVLFDTGLVLCVFHAYKSGNRLAWLAAGFLTGLSAIARPNILVGCAPILWLIWSSRPQGESIGRHGKAVAAAFFLAGAILLPGLVTLRNAVVGGDPVFIASQGGVNFYLGNRPGADGFNPSTPSRYRFDGPYQDSVELYGQRAAEDALGKKLSASEAQNYWYGQGVQWWTRHPIDALKLAAKKWLLAWSHQEIRNNVAFDYVRKEWAPSLSFLFVGFWFAGPLGLVGMALAWNRGRFERFLTVFVLVYFASFAAFFAADRYRLPMVPVLIVFSAYTVIWSVDAVKKAQWRRLAPATACLVATWLFVNIDWYRTVTPATWAQDYWSAGIRYEALGRFDKAEVQDRHAAQLDPGDSEIWSRLGESQYYQHEFVSASSSFETAIRLAPTDPSAFFNLALCYEASGRTDLARPLLVRAAAVDPTYAPARFELAQITNGKS